MHTSLSSYCPMTVCRRCLRKLKHCKCVTCPLCRAKYFGKKCPNHNPPAPPNPPGNPPAPPNPPTNTNPPTGGNNIPPVIPKVSADLQTPFFLNALEMYADPDCRKKILSAIQEAYTYHESGSAGSPPRFDVTKSFRTGRGYFPDPGLQVIVFPSDSRNRIIIAVRGTVEISEWLSNIKFNLGFTNNLVGHAGFIAVAQSGWSELYEKLLTMTVDSPAPHQFVFVGHSLGGAVSHVLAMMMSHQLGKKIPNQVVNITLAQPHVWHTCGNSHRKVESLMGKKNILRIICIGDFVPTLLILRAAFKLLMEFGVYKHNGYERRVLVPGARDFYNCHLMDSYERLLNSEPSNLTLSDYHAR